MSDTRREAVLRGRRHARIRRRLSGTTERPRLSVYRSNRHIFAQVIDDSQGHTLAAASSVEPALRADGTGNTAGADRVGRLVAERARKAGVKVVVFDRGGFRFHGRVAALAQAARNAGLEF
ncbi:MAG: 50S ribosomal protein L18 [Actinomycetota bacterium]|nr:50S ribosomal protein L18 [Actinomycetota bacterium]